MVRLIFLIVACMIFSGCVHIVVPSALSHIVTHSRFDRVGQRLDKLEGKKEEHKEEHKEEQRDGQRKERGERIVYVPSIFRK
jgi:tetrahydromethanopterin S-methyltransferase subunit G